MIYKICVVTRDFKNIYEFIDHHLDLGFDKIVIYDNSKQEKVKYESSKVEIINWDKSIYNCETYNNYIYRFGHEEAWTAFIDEDEFINTENRSIQDAMQEFENFDSVGLNWRVFGGKIVGEIKSNKLKDKYRFFIPESNDISDHIKTFCKNTSIIKFENPHAPIFSEGHLNRNVLGNIIPEYFSKAIHKKIWIDHYHCRDIEGYVNRKIWDAEQNNCIADKQDILYRYNQHNEMATEKL